MVIGKFKNSEEYTKVCAILRRKYPHKSAYFWSWLMVGEDGFIVIAEHVM